jgi:hypothetical protein
VGLVAGKIKLNYSVTIEVKKFAKIASPQAFIGE